jgi:hypothetical protein
MQCALHADPERAARMGSKHGRKITLPSPPNAIELPYKPLKNRGDVIEFLEEMMNLVRQGLLDHRAANAIGFLAGTLLKAFDQRPARTSAEAKAGITAQLYAKRLYLPEWRRKTLERLEKDHVETMTQ